MALNRRDVIEALCDSDSEDEMEFLLQIVAINKYHSRYLCKEPCRTSILGGHAWLQEVIHGHGSRCYDNFRMEKYVFINLCNILKTKGLLKDSKFLSVEEQVAMFLLTVAHNERNRIIAERFQHSGETVSRHFKREVKAINLPGKEIICPPSFGVTPPEIRHDSRYYPFFKNCVGAIDGTHIHAHVPLDKQIPYRGKKIEPTQNIMCACSFDMRFTYVMAGWEGTANDSRIFLECVSDPETGFPKPPREKFYLVDSGYTNMPGFLSPYRGERYHLKDYRGRGWQPLGVEEIFNYRHSSLCNCIERYFGVLKARLSILKQMPSYSLSMQRYIVIACCAVHNFIRTHTTTDRMFEEYEREDLIVEHDGANGASTSDESVEINVTPAQLRYMARIRDEIPHDMWVSKQNAG